MAKTIYILTGSNLGDRNRNLKLALEHMGGIPGMEITATSSVYISEAVEMQGENPSFLNQVIRGEYSYLPSELLTMLEKIETDMGRTDKGKYLPRPIDLDILLFGQQIIDTEQINVPHPRLKMRPFALVPLLQIDPDLACPSTGRPFAEYLSDRQRESVVLYEDHVARTV